jgi:replicative DNA helicase
MLLPRNKASELALLATALYDHTKAEEIVDICRPEYFQSDLTRRGFEALRAMVDTGAPVDAGAMRAQMKKNGGSDSDVGFISQLTNLSPIFADGIEYHVGLIRESWQRLKVVETANRARQEAADPGADFDDTLRRLNQGVMVAEENGHHSTMATLGELVEQVGEKIEAIQQGTEAAGISTGYADLDKVLVGLLPACLYIVAARPGMGKTAFAMALAFNAAQAGLPVGLFSLEMAKDQLALRCLCAHSGIEVATAQAGAFSREDWGRFVEAQTTCHKLPIVFDDQPALHYSDILRRARRMQRTHGIGLLIVDYLQLAQGDRKDGRVMEVASISAALKTISKELKIPVVALSQLNREVERRDPARPKLADLRDSGALEQDADVVCGLFREGHYKKAVDQNKCELIILKNRYGRTGIVVLGWHGKSMRFFNLTKRSE